MSLQLSSQTTQHLQQLSKILKIEEEKLLERAVKYYIYVLKDEANLKEETEPLLILPDKLVLKI